MIEGLGQRIASRREALHLTQRELEQRAELPRTSLSKIEKGTRDVTVDELFALARVLRTSVDALRGAEPPDDPWTETVSTMRQTCSAKQRKMVAHLLRQLAEELAPQAG